MGNNSNPDAELERLASFHDQIARLREKVRVLKEKQSDASSDSYGARDGEEGEPLLRSNDTSKNY
jgi:hypothetical protein